MSTSIFTGECAIGTFDYWRVIQKYSSLYVPFLIVNIPSTFHENIPPDKIFPK
jgi:hypothetical protein